MIGCERCGTVDETLRVTSFIYAISLLLVTFRRGAGGVFCSGCRKKVGLKYSVISAIFGWWGIPWGPLYTLQALGRNSAGGYQDDELNADLLQAVASQLIDEGDKSTAIRALEASLRLQDDGTVRQVLWSLQGEAASVATPPAVAAQSSDALLAAQPSFRPGQLVTSANGSVPLYPSVAGAGEPVAHLGSEQAVVMRAHDGWVEIQMPGGRAGWARVSEIVAV